MMAKSTPSNSQSYVLTCSVLILSLRNLWRQTAKLLVSQHIYTTYITFMANSTRSINTYFATFQARVHLELKGGIVIGLCRIKPWGKIWRFPSFL